VTKRNRIITSSLLTANPLPQGDSVHNRKISATKNRATRWELATLSANMLHEDHFACLKVVAPKALAQPLLDPLGRSHNDMPFRSKRTASCSVQPADWVHDTELGKASQHGMA
jgi:hypothetical protein